MNIFDSNRTFMKSGFDVPGREFISDQDRGIQPPVISKKVNCLKTIALPSADKKIVKQNDLYTCINNRRSRRTFKDTPITLEELSFLLWSTQGIQKIIPAYKNTGYITLRPVPSAGGRHSFETYIAANNVTGLDKGIYTYLPIDHKLAFMYAENNLEEKLIHAYGGENYKDEAQWLGKAPLVMLWSCIPERGEWRYHMEAHRLMLIDIGHVCQNLYLACEGLEFGVCAIAAYIQKEFDSLLHLDGKNEFTVYASGIGKLD